MPSFAFETITAAQALAITQNDALVFFSTSPDAGVHASAATVLYDSPSLITISVAGHAVDFGIGVEAASLLGHVAFFDSSTLYVGDNSSNTIAAGAVTGSAMFGGGGDDTLQAGGPFDLLQGNTGGDSLQSSGGLSTVYGGQDNDMIVVSGASNFAQGNKGDDTIQGQALGVDTLLGGQGDDHIAGGGILDGNLGNDLITGTGQLLGEGGNDTLISPGAHDVLTGGDGDDSLSATHGADSLNGGAGNDTIDGSSNPSTIAGGGGSDRFIVGAGSVASGGGPQIIDWDGAHDVISFTGFTVTATNFATATAADYVSALTAAQNITATQSVNFVEVQVGANLFIFAGDQDTVTAQVELVGRSLTDFTVSNLI